MAQPEISGQPGQLEQPSGPEAPPGSILTSMTQQPPASETSAGSAGRSVDSATFNPDGEQPIPQPAPSGQSGQPDQPPQAAVCSPSLVPEPGFPHLEDQPNAANREPNPAPSSVTRYSFQQPNTGWCMCLCLQAARPQSSGCCCRGSWRHQRRNGTRVGGVIRPAMKVQQRRVAMGAALCLAASAACWYLG